MESLNNFPSECFSEPVDHVLVRAGFCSERSFMTFIKNHEVYIRKNDTSGVSEKVLVSSRKVTFDTQGAEIFVDGNKISVPEHLYFILNKPVDVVCSKVSDSHKTVFDFLPGKIKSDPLFEHLHIAGRLDADSRGLVFLTTNGSLSNFISAPETHLKKTYEVILENSVSEKEKEIYKREFMNGMGLPSCKKGEGFRTKPAELSVMEGNEGSVFLVSLEEGKFRQIRRMFSHLGNEVKDLKRISIGSLCLPSDLEEGEVLQLFRNSRLPK